MQDALKEGLGELLSYPDHRLSTAQPSQLSQLHFSLSLCLPPDTEASQYPTSGRTYSCGLSTA